MVLLDGVPRWALVPGAINALPPGCCLGPPSAVAMQLWWCGSAGGISDTDSRPRHTLCVLFRDEK